ncbi:ATP-binding protein [Streptomyces sp. DH24]|uniref:ATP-binding protein n=1 Tax=Streptomyces sp. DH24 TaxID=3040123 RepID=UPI002441AFC5|nr:ATP-binding protein [Streptomyces sp. DH24]MDG9717037.1 ATP-binding protein [Streptomyces sp. DH24]
MTTTAVQTPRAATGRAGDVMSECFKVTRRPRGTKPPADDTYRVAAMRRIAAARLRYCGLGAMADDVTLIVSELLTNALIHSGATEVSLRITVDGDTLRIAVRDGMPGRAQPGTADAEAESGRGLTLVDALARENGGAWGTSDAGAETWCSLTVPCGEQQ